MDHASGSHTASIPFASHPLFLPYLSQVSTFPITQVLIQLPTTNTMLPINRHRSPFSVYRSQPIPGNPTSPVRHCSYSINRQNQHMEHENLPPRREMTRYFFHPRRQFFSILPSQFSCNIDVALHFNAGLAERFLTPQSSLHICIPVLIASSCCNGILHIRDELTATISISASIQDVFESLARETERCSVGSTLGRVEGCLGIKGGEGR
jgi:hypothetical protein